MKNGKKPNRQQKNALTAVGLNYENWLVYKQDTKQGQLHITHRFTGTTRVIPA